MPQPPTPYPELDGILRDLAGSVESALGATFIGAYLQGSFAVGDFDEHSDVDFIVVTAGELSEPQVGELQQIHGRIYDLGSEWAKHLEGSYFPADTLRAHGERGKPLWYEIRATILGWGREILAKPELYANRFYQGYLVLNYARMLHDLVAGRPGSKRAGADWAKATLGVEWVDLIDDAWGARPNPALSVRTPADPRAFARTLDFIRVVMTEAEAP